MDMSSGMLMFFVIVIVAIDFNITRYLTDCSNYKATTAIVSTKNFAALYPIRAKPAIMHTCENN